MERNGITTKSVGRNVKTQKEAAEVTGVSIGKYRALFDTYKVSGVPTFMVIGTGHHKHWPVFDI